MNLIERLEVMAHNAESYRRALTLGHANERHAEADREAIETVRAMQEALQAAIKAIENEGLPYRGWHGDIREALRRAGGES